MQNGNLRQLWKWNKNKMKTIIRVKIFEFGSEFYEIACAYNTKSACNYFSLLILCLKVSPYFMHHNFESITTDIFRIHS